MIYLSKMFETLTKTKSAAVLPSWPLGLSGTPRSATAGLEPGTPQGCTVECLGDIISKGLQPVDLDQHWYGVFYHSAAAWGPMFQPSWGHVVKWLVSIIPVTMGAPIVTQWPKEDALQITGSRQGEEALLLGERFGNLWCHHSRAPVTEQWGKRVIWQNESPRRNLELGIVYIF
jgi:hypothetical protein